MGQTGDASGLTSSKIPHALGEYDSMNEKSGFLVGYSTCIEITKTKHILQRSYSDEFQISISCLKNA